MRYDLEETIIAGLMCNKPVVIVEGQDDIKFYDNIATLNDLNVDICAVETIEGYSEGCEQVINAMAQAESLIHNDDSLKMYIMGIIDRDVRQYLNNVPEMENLLVLKYYSYETHLITGLFGWSLFAAGTVVAVFDTAIEYQCGKANVKTAALNILKGFFACSLIGVLPVELYKFCITLQNIFSRDLAALAAGTKSTGLSELSLSALTNFFLTDIEANISLFNTLSLVAFAYCIIKVFFANIKRGGILLIQMSVGALYMFSVPRGYADGFNQWCKQVIAICLTAFLQTTLLYLGLITFSANMLMGLGIMLAADEVPKIAQTFGLDSSVRVNMMNVVHATTTAVNLTRSVAKAV